jgi:hypothetical protein
MGNAMKTRLEWGSVDEGLDAKELRFVEEYLVDLNSTRAARAAGYLRGDTGRALLKRPHVRAAVERRMRERRERLKLSQDYVIERLIKEAECDAAEGNATARVRALELLGKHLGMFWDRQEVVQRSEVVYVEVAGNPVQALPEERPALPAGEEEQE